MKKFILGPFVFGLILAAGWAGGSGFWTNVCPGAEIAYCKDIGKTAYDYHGMFKLGQIIGVTWTLEEPAATSPPNSPQERVYYYLIDDGTGSQAFVREIGDVTAR
ncbi:MAG: hypothetical protein GTN81_16095 [Proteobacteria bacterium]|nr:hypothetical protein [Pseudomonadota bacterium]